MEVINSIKMQSSLLIRKKGFQISFLLLFAYAILISVIYAYMQKGSYTTEMIHPAMISGITSDVDYVWFFCRYFPFMAVMPAGFSFINDINTKTSVLLKAQMGEKRYYMGKLVSVFLITFITFTFPFFIELLLNVIIFPFEGTRAATGWEAYSLTYVQYANNHLMSRLFYNNIYIYYIISTALTGIFAGAGAVFTVGISSFGIKYKAFLFLPFYLFIYLAENISKYIISSYTYIDTYITIFDIIEGKSMAYYLTLIVLLMIMGIIFTAINIRRNETR